MAVLFLITSCAATYPNPEFGNYLVSYRFVDGPEAVKAHCGGRNVNACMEQVNGMCLVILDGNKPWYYDDHEKAHCFNVLTHD